MVTDENQYRQCSGAHGDRQMIVSWWRFMLRCWYRFECRQSAVTPGDVTGALSVTPPVTGWISSGAVVPGSQALLCVQVSR